jgi:hypothetical protein
VSRRDCQEAQRCISKRQRQHALEVAISAAPDCPTTLLLSAEYERKWHGFVNVGGRDTHDPYQLGLNDVCREMSVLLARTRLRSGCRVTWVAQECR